MSCCSLKKHPPVVLITGALTGIGRATALAYARKGANVVISGRRDAAGQALLVEMQALGAQALFVHADTSREADMQGLVAQTLSHFGRLDIAVNNAGIEGELGPITGQSESNYRAVFDTNVLGVLLGMKHQLPPMVAQGGGAIVNVSSVAGRVGMAGAAVYVASKHAVEGLTKSAALEVAASGVRVNAVAPGPVETPMLNRFTGGDAGTKAGLIALMPAKRAATADEIADAILFLASDKSKYITGERLAIDGGYTAQ